MRIARPITWRVPWCYEPPGTPLVVEYSKCKASPGRTTPKIACAAIAASLNPSSISFNFPGYVAISPIANTPATDVAQVAGSTLT